MDTPQLYNFATQEMTQMAPTHTHYDDTGNVMSVQKNYSLRNAPPLSNYIDVNWAKKYLDADIELYFAQEQLKAIKKILILPNALRLFQHYQSYISRV
jgi:hypothetical protein